MGEGGGQIGVGAGAARVGAGTGVGEAEAGAVPLEWLAEAQHCHVRRSRRWGKRGGEWLQVSLALAFARGGRDGERSEDRGEAASLAYKRAVVGGSKEETALAGGRDGKGRPGRGARAR